MSSVLIRLSILGSVLTLIAGCGSGSSAGSSGGGTGGGGNGGSGSTTVTFTFTGANPTAVATQIGSGSFAAANLSSGKLVISIPSGTTDFAVAFVCPPLSGTAQPQEMVYEASTLDGASFSEACSVPSPTSPTSATLTGSVDASAIPGASYLNIDSSGGGFLFGGYLGSPTSPFSVSAPPGTDRVEVLAYAGSADIAQGGSHVVAAKNFDNQIVPGALNGGSTVVLGPGDETTAEPITYSGVPSGFGAPSTIASLTMSGGDGIELASSVATQYPALPATAVDSGDYYSFIAVASNSSSSSQSVGVIKTLGTAGPLSIAFSQPWSYTGPTPAALPTFDFAYSGFSGATGVNYMMAMSWPSTGTSQALYKVTATANSLNGSTSVTFPNLSGLTGFLASPISGTSVQWQANISQDSGSSSQANTTVTNVANSGSFIVP